MTEKPRPAAMAVVVLAVLLFLPVEVGLFMLAIGHTTAFFAGFGAVAFVLSARRLFRRK
ncbi:hypothetical protein M2271_003555 [Streptomyces sp. LBL]|uniref:hypothetical protein n=1 Tax=Streptomyces sp. LBL TaxID=2940562 RepID=UPI0024762307|nr:hypothetical protein [Streptomyces sp. LBL]MDH6625744.1 hypothetical protein [Streptomyces sp. LBL]